MKMEKVGLRMLKILIPIGIFFIFIIYYIRKHKEEIYPKDIDEL